MIKPEDNDDDDEDEYSELEDDDQKSETKNEDYTAKHLEGLTGGIMQSNSKTEEGDLNEDQLIVKQPSSAS